MDSPRVDATPGSTLDLTAVTAPDPASAAYYYPAGHWLSLVHVPERSEFPGTGPEGNGISPNITVQAEWLRRMKSGTCTACHQLGSIGTREIPAALGEFESSVAAWERRILSGQAGAGMSGSLGQMGRERALEMFADWTDRIAAGEVPVAPARRTGRTADRNAARRNPPRPHHLEP